MTTPFVSPEWARTMARYTAWQNAAQREAILALPDGALRRDRGAFFGSILGTANHLLWGDRIWLARFRGEAAPPSSIADSVALTPDAAAWAEARAATDAELTAWAGRLTEADVAGELTWWSGAQGREVRRPRGVLLVHVFNHGTHHRGQLHAMLTAAGARLPDTDLAFLPEPDA